MEWKKGNTTAALIYWLGSMLVGMLGVQLGVTLGKLNSKSSVAD
jgi:fluoride exporter